MIDLTMLAEHQQLRRLRPWLDAHTTHLDASLVGRIELCIHELAANVIDHSGSPEFSLHLVDQPSQMSIELHDSGAPLEPSSAADLEPHPRVRGYGMMIAEQLASELSYERRGTMNVWRATFDHS